VGAREWRYLKTRCARMHVVVAADSGVSERGQVAAKAEAMACSGGSQRRSEARGGMRPTSRRWWLRQSSGSCAHGREQQVACDRRQAASEY
jgi:hypothetical protein